MKKNRDLKEMSIMEASDFWDEHDFSEFDDVKTARDIKFLLEKNMEASLRLGINSFGS